MGQINGKPYFFRKFRQKQSSLFYFCKNLKKKNFINWWDRSLTHNCKNISMCTPHFALSSFIGKKWRKFGTSENDWKYCMRYPIFFFPLFFITFLQYLATLSATTHLGAWQYNDQCNSLREHFNKLSSKCQRKTTSNISIY